MEEFVAGYTKAVLCLMPENFPVSDELVGFLAGDLLTYFPAGVAALERAKTFLQLHPTREGGEALAAHMQGVTDKQDLIQFLGDVPVIRAVESGCEVFLEWVV